LLDRFTLDQLLVGSRAKGVRFFACADRVLQLPRAIERLRRTDAEGRQVLPILGCDLTPEPEFDLNHRDAAAADEKRHGGDPVEPGCRRRRRVVRVLASIRSSRLDHHRGSAADRVSRGCVAFERMRTACVAFAAAVAHGPRDVRRLVVACRDEKHRGVRCKRVQRLLHGGFDDRFRCSRARKCVGELRDALGSGSCLLSGVPLETVTVGAPVGPEEDERE
jgi:hypothetical protein